MTSVAAQHPADEEPRPRRRPARGGFGRFLFRLAAELFGGGSQPDTQAKPPHVGPMPKEQSSAPAAAGAAPTEGDAAAVLREALAHVESMPRDLADLRRWLGVVFQHLDDVLSRLDGEAHRLAETSTRLSDIAVRLEAQVSDAASPLPAAAEPAAPEEPVFSPGDQVGIVLSAVPGFQGLMDVQRTLTGLAEVEAASVVAYKNGEASIEVTLRAPLTASRIVDGLYQTTGQPLLIEDVRPEASLLRLRFVEQGR